MSEEQQLTEEDLKVGKRELADFVWEQVGLNKNDAEQAVDAVFDFIFGSIMEGLSVGIQNFGVFGSRTRAERMRRNPYSGEKVFVPERRYPAFKFSPVVKKSIHKRDNADGVTPMGGDNTEE